MSEELARHLRQLIGLEKEKVRAYCWAWKSGYYGGFIGTGSNWESSYDTPSDPQYGLKSTEKADSSCNQRNCSRSNGADWNGNFGNRGGRGGNNTARCSDRCGCSCRKKYQAP